MTDQNKDICTNYKSEIKRTNDGHVSHEHYNFCVLLPKTQLYLYFILFLFYPMVPVKIEPFS